MWVRMKGEMGEAPSWFNLIRAARYLHVPPWDLARKPIWWINAALATMAAENVSTAPDGK